MPDDPMPAIKRLRQRLVEEVAPLGLDVIGFNLLVQEDGSHAPDMVQVVFGIHPEALLSDDEKLAKRDADVLKEMELNMAKDSLSDREEEAKVDIQEWLDEG